MTSTFADGEFWSKKSTIPSGIDENISSLIALFNLDIAFRVLVVALRNLAALSTVIKLCESGTCFTFNDFKLLKEVSLSSNKWGIRKRTWAVRDEDELEAQVIDYWQNFRM